MNLQNKEVLDHLTRELIHQFIELRRKRGMTQEECNYLLGVADFLVAKWECGMRVPKIFHMLCWAEALNARVVLLPYDDDEWPEQKQANDNLLQEASFKKSA